jgi:4'-phosphopantetheinyl transferase
VRAAAAADRPLLVSLLWSVKESALKALRTGLRLGTRWVAVDPPAPADSGRWHALTVRHPPLAGSSPDGGATTPAAS